MNIHIPFINNEAYTFTDEKIIIPNRGEAVTMSAADKWQVLHDWQQFLLNGCKKLFFTPTLHRYLVTYCDFNGYNREQFWLTHCAGSAGRLKALMAQFGGDRRSAEHGNYQWLNGPTADLKEAMCREASLLYPPLIQVLEDLEIKHREMITAWHDFALNANITDAALPPHYQISENTRHLLAYAAQIALKHQRPLTGLQLMFPLEYQALLKPVPVAAGEMINGG
ncbi:MAG: hypothetical protein JXM69_18015 [Anaerolineae bacterium]|nr:hypothetical protein [Anaerolineae bacterium]